MYWCLIYCYMFRHFKMPSSGSPIWTSEMVPNVVKSREGWELYIVTDCVMVGILSRPLCRLSQYRAVILLCFSRHWAHLSMFILDSLIMAFWSAETCRSILSTNILNEWCICWSFTHRKKMHGPNCKMYFDFLYELSLQYLTFYMEFSDIFS
jgi:hypothetical protein